MDSEDENIIQINNLRENLKNWASGDEKIDNFIEEMQLKIDEYDDDDDDDLVFEWIPYDQFNDIKEIEKNDDFTVYSAIWKDGPLKHHEVNLKSDVVLKCFHNTPYEFLDEV